MRAYCLESLQLVGIVAPAGCGDLAGIGCISDCATATESLGRTIRLHTTGRTGDGSGLGAVPVPVGTAAVVEWDMQRVRMLRIEGARTSTKRVC